MPFHINRILLLAGLCFAIFTAASQSQAQTASKVMAPAPSLTYGGREYVLHVPPSPTRITPRRPLLVVLHGGMGNATWMQQHLNMNSTADKYGFIVAYLNGTSQGTGKLEDNRTWNSGGGCCGQAEKNNVNDVGYINGFIRHAIANHQVDGTRVYIAGHSNGSMMTYRFICENPGVAAAAVVLSGPLMVNTCQSKAPDVLHIHGEVDDSVPIEGGFGNGIFTKNIFFKPVKFGAVKIVNAGGTFKLKIVPSAGHSLEEIDTIIQQTDGITLPETIGRFIRGK